MLTVTVLDAEPTVPVGGGVGVGVVGVGVVGVGWETGAVAIANLPRIPAPA
jgi:hypothetical protein